MKCLISGIFVNSEQGQVKTDSDVNPTFIDNYVNQFYQKLYRGQSEIPGLADNRKASVEASFNLIYSTLKNDSSNSGFPEYFFMNMAGTISRFINRSTGISTPTLRIASNIALG